MTKRCGLVILMALSIVAANAQNDSRRASIRGNRGESGKCTIEVDVDGVAEVEISGEQAVLHTLSGTPSRWVRFECNDALPRVPDDFRFRGIDGRGRQTLIREPRDNRGVAVIRIEDPQGGREGYTFDIEWRGYANSITNQRPGNNGGFDNGRPDDRTRGGTNRAVEGCIQSVRDKANRDFGYRNIDIKSATFDDNPGRRDYVIGRFAYRRGLSQDEFEFTCSVDLNNGRVRNVQIRRF